MRRPQRSIARAAAAALTIAVAATPAIAQTIVDLTRWQTDIRNQRERRSCIVFAAIANLEARYKRLGMTLDLSEEFAMSMDKLNWLHANWNDLPTADTTENQLVGLGGGGGADILLHLQEWMRVPLETAMPYRYGANAHVLPHPWNSTHWRSQRNVNTWNLDPANLPRTALNQQVYYSATSHVRMSGAESRSPAAIEAVLQRGFEVVWDFEEHPTGSTGRIWHATSFGRLRGAHSMLIVGYDRSSPDPANHYFIVKNSWGPTANPGGFTYVSYDYLRLQGLGAGYITGIRTPGPAPEYRFLGRRNLSFDGWRGTLDVYHLPRSFDAPWRVLRGLTMSDWRVGTFYDSAGVAHRVNGFISGNELTFWFKGQTPNMRWDEQRSTPTLGRMFKLRIVDGDGDELAGIHWDNAGSTPSPAFGNYARRPSRMTANDGFLSPRFDTRLAATPEQWFGRWNLQVADRAGEFVIAFRNDSLVPPTQAATHAGLFCYVRTPGGPWFTCRAITERTTSRTLQITFPEPFLPGSLNAYMLSWQRGVAAGQATVAGMTLQAGYLARAGEHEFGMLGTYGTGCGPTGGVPRHSVLGTPEYGQTLQFAVEDAPPRSACTVMIGLSNTSFNGGALPLDLRSLGAPGCRLLADPMITMPTVADGNGTALASQRYDIPALRGVRLYSQFLVLRPGYNALGAVFSNGANTRLGGRY